ncbi:hypothetical protein TNCV_1780151 [Trichonephila clavipes]|nr:hypothetical protein TNCV_1780151 [Trichonephila clavipes]
MNEIQKTLAVLDCSIVLSEEFISVDDDNACTATTVGDKNIFFLEFVHGSKSINDADSEDENAMNNAVPVPTSSEMRNIMKRVVEVNIIEAERAVEVPEGSSRGVPTET